MARKADLVINDREALLERERLLLTELKRIEADIDERKKETDRISGQIQYYSSLIRDMKRAVQPPTVDDIMRVM